MNDLSWIFDPNAPFLFSEVFIWLIFKIMFLIGFGVYVIFAFVIIRQIHLMGKTLHTNVNGLFKILGLAHFLLAVGIWIFALLTLPF